MHRNFSEHFFKIVENPIIFPAHPVRTQPFFNLFASTVDIRCLFFDLCQWTGNVTFNSRAAKARKQLTQCKVNTFRIQIDHHFFQNVISGIFVLHEQVPCNSDNQKTIIFRGIQQIAEVIAHISRNHNEMFFKKKRRHRQLRFRTQRCRLTQNRFHGTIRIPDHSRPA